MNINSEIIKYLLKYQPKKEVDILRAKRKFCKELNIAKPPTDPELLQELKKYPESKTKNLLPLLRKRHIRTMSGIAPIAVLTKEYPCHGKCVYCPGEKSMPKSYLSNEPAVMRAILCKFDPYTQVQMRLRALENNGHSTDKLELIVMGGTWSYLPEKYQIWYLKECYRGANDYPKKNKAAKSNSITELKEELDKQQKKNEDNKNKIIGLTLETRPDYVNKEELTKMREYGCTRIEIGVQHIDDEVLKLNKRGHGQKEIVDATKLMRDFGFKITYHLMLNLPGSTPAKDYKMFKTIFTDCRFQPDQIKIYPCVVSKSSLLYRWYNQGKWKSYTTKVLVNLILKIKSITPPWVRIIRVIRDIPEESIIAGNKITNLRQIIKQRPDFRCSCIRCREAGHQKSELNQAIKLKIRKYKAGNGQECFLSYESKDEKILYAFCRLYLPKNLDTAIIRELHTYGQMTPIGKNGQVQHRGLGKKLMAEAEHIVQKNNYNGLAVISGIGVRGYYRKLGYKLKRTYMLKKFI